MKPHTRHPGTSRLAWLSLFFLSGAAGLAYEVLWFRELRVVFGNTPHAVAVLLGIFFASVACGASFFGRRFAQRNPARVYALLECSVAVSVLVYVVAFRVVADSYPQLSTLVGTDDLLLGLARSLISALLIGPPAFFIGGTFPVMIRIARPGRETFGRAGALVYAVNTLGAVLGALAAGFLLPQVWGFTTQYLAFAGLNAALAASALALSREARPPLTPASSESRQGVAAVPPGTIVLAFASGAAFLAAEAVWIRMVALITAHDVHAVSAVLSMAILSLALGGAVAHRLTHSRRDPSVVFRGLLWSAALLLPLTVFWFSAVREGSGVTGGFLAAGGFARLVALAAFLILPAGTVTGGVFPYLLKLAEPSVREMGETAGTLVFWNTAGAIAGALCGGFLMAPHAGVFWSMGLLGTLYAVMAVAVSPAPRRPHGLAALLGVAALAFVAARGRHEVTLLAQQQEALEATYRGAAGAVAVVAARPAHYPEGVVDRYMKLDNYYILGGLGAAAHERRQGHLPILLHSSPRSVFFIGMGTGITAGAALAHPLQRIVVSEINGQVVRAAREHFREETRGLFVAPHVEIAIEDARQYLLANRERFDVIIGDLIDARAVGAGNLYSREHFQLVSSRLEPGGIFALWLPLHQLSPEEFGIVARTALAVFPHVTLWRGNFDPEQPIVALVAQTAPRPLDADALLRADTLFGGSANGTEELIDLLVSLRGLSALAVAPATRSAGFRNSVLPHLARRVPFTFYAGNVSTHARLFDAYPLETDDHPRIEYLAARKRAGAAQRAGFSLEDLRSLLTSLAAGDTIASDPYLAALSPARLAYVRAGLSYALFTTYDYEARQVGRAYAAEAGRAHFAAYLRGMELDRLQQDR